jgi:ferritin
MVIKENSKDLKFGDYTVHPEVQKLLVEQLSNELYNKLLYESFANYFSLEGLSELERYYRDRANEEELHYQWIKKFLAENDCEYEHPGVNDISEAPKDRIEPFEMTLDAEIETTEDIYRIVEKAQECKDHITYQWLMSDDTTNGALVKEQMEELSTSRQALDLASGNDSWIVKAEAIYKFYKQNS